METDQGPVSKKRKTASVIVDQPAESDKMVVDQVTDVSATFDEVCNNESVRESFLVLYSNKMMMMMMILPTACFVF